MIPSQVTLVPLYIIFSRLHWINTFRPLIIPAFFGVPFFIFLLRQFFLQRWADRLSPNRGQECPRHCITAPV